MTTFRDALCVMIDRTLFTKKLQRCIRTERSRGEDAPLLSGVPDLVHPWNQNQDPWQLYWQVSPKKHNTGEQNHP